MSNPCTKPMVAVSRATSRPALSRAVVLVACLASTLVACRSSHLRALSPEASENARRYAAECDDGVASSCYALSLVYYFGDENAQGVPKDVDRAATLRDLACSRGHAPACAGPPEPMPAAR